MVVSPESFPFMVLGNKLDLESDRAVKSDMVQKYCADNGDIDCIEVSAKDNKNVEEAFLKLAK
jgi:GTPase SAR1 family protein